MDLGGNCREICSLPIHESIPISNNLAEYYKHHTSKNFMEKVSSRYLNLHYLNFVWLFLLQKYSMEFIFTLTVKVIIDSVQSLTWDKNLQDKNLPAMD